MSDDYDDDYTPSVDQVRETFADAIWDQYGDTPWSHWAEGVDRMIESVRAEERERIAQAIEAEAPSPGEAYSAATVGSRRNGMIAAARIAREGA